MKVDKEFLVEAITELAQHGKRFTLWEVQRNPEALLRAYKELLEGREKDDVVEEVPEDLQAKIADATKVLQAVGLIEEKKKTKNAVRTLVDSIMEDESIGPPTADLAEGPSMEELEASITKEDIKQVEREMTNANSSIHKINAEIDKKIAALRPRLTAKDVIFAQSYVQHRNRAVAARECGSKAERPEVTGAVMMRKPELQEYIALLTQKQSDIAALKAAEVIGKFRQIYDQAMEDGNYKEANIAARNLAEICGAIGKSTADAPVTKKQKGKAADKESIQDRKARIDELLSKTAST